jgi:hypothetical protein
MALASNVVAERLRVTSTAGASVRTSTCASIASSSRRSGTFNVWPTVSVKPESRTGANPSRSAVSS